MEYFIFGKDFISIDLALFDFCFCSLGMADFQYLPIVKGNNGNMEQIHDKIVFNTFMDRNEFLDRDVPVFLPPVIFSR